MNQEWKDVLLQLLWAFFIVSTILFWSLIPTSCVYDDAYKKGQTDALLGRIKYEMVVKQDTTWNALRKQ